MLHLIYLAEMAGEYCQNLEHNKIDDEHLKIEHYNIKIWSIDLFGEYYYNHDLILID